MRRTEAIESIGVLITALCLLTFYLGNAAIASETDWSVFVDHDSKGKVCWAVSRANDRGETLMFVTRHRGDRQSEVSIKIVPIPESMSRVSLQVGNRVVTMFLRKKGGELWAWPRSKADEKRIVSAVQTFERAIGGTTGLFYLIQEGAVIASFSAKGFGHAMGVAMKECS
ncbi:hypothetical protein [Tropicimonas aquimaris]|uniref:Invasion associated locus B (IalB) protein n=1 Tax=Tropicimonas aquimaris TaxID=914152 RepID=A0ABW3IJT1_9RHOB